MGLKQCDMGNDASALESTVITVSERISSRACLSFEQDARLDSSLAGPRYKLDSPISLRLDYESPWLSWIQLLCELDSSSTSFSKSTEPLSIAGIESSTNSERAIAAN